MPETTTPKYRLETDTHSNGRVGKTIVRVLDADDKVLLEDHFDLRSSRGRKKAARGLAASPKVPGADEDKFAEELERLWNDGANQRRQMKKQAEAGSPEAVPVVTVELLDAEPEAVRRPLCLAGGRAYAAAWCQARLVTRRSVDPDTLRVREHSPPLETVEERLVIVRDDGAAFTDGAGLPGARPLAEMGLPVRLSAPVRPGRGWSGAGVKRYLAGERPDPANVFGRVVSVVCRYLDFDRSLAPQETMCELVGCYALSTYLLDAFHVVGYLWPNGGAGSGKTTLLNVVAEMGYLGEVILGSSTCATLRDLADYGATLAFDDAEAVMDVKRTDPDKRTLLLAGNRRGAYVAVKEPAGKDRWVTRHVHAFCPRLFSAIRLPDPVLGSRSIVVPLVRSGDEKRTKASVQDHASWPCDRRRLIDDLWALGLAHLAELPRHDAEAAALARLAGRDLEPWRALLAVAHWLQERHGVAGLFRDLERLSMTYQSERQDFDPASANPRLLLWALRELIGNKDAITFTPGELAKRAKAIAGREDLDAADVASAEKVGWFLKKLRFQRADRTGKGRTWQATREEVEYLALAYAVPERAPDTEPEPAPDADVASDPQGGRGPGLAGVVPERDPDADVFCV
jgi:hypothetical protein